MIEVTESVKVKAGHDFTVDMNEIISCSSNGSRDEQYSKELARELLDNAVQEAFEAGRQWEVSKHKN